MAKLVGLSGYAGTGKSEAARFLVKKGFTHLKFAGPLKDMLRALGLNEREIEGDLKELPCAKLNGKTPRYAMQTLGTEWGRDLIGPDVWVDAAMARADDELDIGGKVVLDDVRFPNEVEAIRKRGGLVLRINRPGVGPVNAHASDNYTLPWDVVVENDGTLEQFLEIVSLYSA